MMSTRGVRPGYRLFVLGAVVAVVALALPVSTHRADAAASPPTVTLNGEGSWDVDAELGSWEADMYNDTGGDLAVGSATCAASTGAPLGCVTVGYSPNGDQVGLQGLVNGTADYAISGVPIQQTSLKPAAVPGTIIAAPIMPSGLAFIFNEPDGGLTFESEDAYGTPVNSATFGPQPNGTLPYPVGQEIPGCNPPTSTSDGCPPFEVPATNLAAMMGGGGINSTGVTHDWDDPAIVSIWDQEGLDLGSPDDCGSLGENPLSGVACQVASEADPNDYPSVWIRQDPDDDNYYEQQWFTDPNTPATGGVTPASVWDPPGTTSPPAPTEFPVGTTTGGTKEGLISLLESSWDVLTPENTGGSLVEAPPSGRTLADQNFEKSYQAALQAHLTPVQIPVPEDLYVQNDDGDWVSPTPAAIEAGVNAGAAARESACSDTSTTTKSNLNALYGADHKVPGAYPVSWVDCLYAPTQGLSIAKTDALSGLVRYLVTDGQSYLEPDGDGKLPESYVKQALTAANTIVTDNCPGAGGQVAMTADPTIYSPVSTGVTALGAVDECEAPTNPTPITTPTTTASSPSTTGPSSPTTTASSPSTTGPSSPTTTASSPSTTGPSWSTATAGGSSSAFLGSGLADYDTTTGGGSASTSSSSGSGAASSSGNVAANKTSSPSAGAPAGNEAKKAKVDLSAAIAANLPEPLTGTGGQSIDKLSALLLGGLLFLGARRLVRRILRARAK
jgi:hypothetical protein